MPAPVPETPEDGNIPDGMEVLLAFVAVEEVCKDNEEVLPPVANGTEFEDPVPPGWEDELPPVPVGYGPVELELCVGRPVPCEPPPDIEVADCDDESVVEVIAVRMGSLG